MSGRDHRLRQLAFDLCLQILEEARYAVDSGGRSAARCRDPYLHRDAQLHRRGEVLRAIQDQEFTPEKRAHAEAEPPLGNRQGHGR